MCLHTVLTYTRVLDVAANGPLEEAATAVTAEYAVMPAEALVAAYLTGDGDGQGAAGAASLDDGHDQECRDDMDAIDRHMRVSVASNGHTCRRPSRP